MPDQRFSLSEINAFSPELFCARLSPLFEGPPWILEAAVALRPFVDRDHLYRVLCQIMYDAAPAQHLLLLNAHPDLVGRAALAGTLTPASMGEQASAGLDRLLPAEIAAFTRFNEQYHARFGFPFIICARENKKESILSGFIARLPHTRDEEIQIALHEVARICFFRLLDLVSDLSADQ